MTFLSNCFGTSLIKGDNLTREIILIRNKYVFSTSYILSIYIAVGISDDIADSADNKFKSLISNLLLALFLKYIYRWKTIFLCYDLSNFYML